MNLSSRLDKLEQQRSPRFRRLSEEERAVAVAERMHNARLTVAWHAAHPHGSSGPRKYDAPEADEVTLEMISASPDVCDRDRKIAVLLLAAESRRQHSGAA